MKNNSNVKYEFIDSLETPSFIVDVNNQVFKLNDRLKMANKTYNIFDFKTEDFYIPHSSQIDSTDWQKKVNQCLEKGSSDFIIKSGLYKCTMTRFASEGNKFILVSLFENTENGILETEEKLQNDAQMRIKELLDLASHTAHAINNPLTVVLTRAQMLKQVFDMQKPVTNEMTAVFLDKVTQQTERIKKIVDGMRVLTKTPPPEDHVDYNVGSLVDEAHMSVTDVLNQKGVSFVFNYDQKNRLIRCKPSELIQLFANLFNNSIHALADIESPRIEINMEEDATHIHFYFSDNGSGVKEENEAKIFTAFFTTKSVGANTGLGLNISRKFARSYGGDVEFDRSRGSSCFHISLSKSFITECQELDLNLQDFKKSS